VVERISSFACEFGIGKAFVSYLAHGEFESLAVIHVFAVVESEHLLIEVTVKVKRLYGNIGSMQPALYETPEVLKGVRVNAAMDVLGGMIYDLMVVFAIKSGISPERVCVESRASLDVFPDERLQVVLTALRYDLSPNFPATLHESDYDRLVIVYATSEFIATGLVHVPRFAADEGLIYFNFAIWATAELLSKEVILPRPSATVEA
jgi:hypothetical protein